MFNFDFLAKYASQLGAKKVLQKAIDDLKNHENPEEKWEEHAPFFYFLPAEYVGKVPEKQKSLPRMQTLRDAGILKKKKIPLVDAFRGKGIIKNILFVSHRWEEPDQPDVDGEQLSAIKAYLEKHPEIEWVWFDYSSMPQKTGFHFDTRTREEKAEFDLMLAAITDLYLTSRVLILLDGSYASRFWTLTEAWCSMQTVTSDGLRPATEAQRRYTIQCIHTADEKHDVAGLVEKVSQKTPEEMFDHLKKPDVNVTNAKDKVAMLPVIKKTNEHVIETFQKLDIDGRVQTSAVQVSAFGAESMPTGEPAPSVVACSPHSSTRGHACHMA